MVDDNEGPGSLRGLSFWKRDGKARLYLRPLGLAGDLPDKASLPLAGGPLRFDRAELILYHDGVAAHAAAPLDAVRRWARSNGYGGRLDDLLEPLCRKRPLLGRAPFAAAGGPAIMGIVNVTPDSFSDGGEFLDTDRAIAHGLALRDQGADILDVGGESTRPGAAPVTPLAELRRVLPVIVALAAAGATVSIDTRHAAVMRAALAAGAAMVNDVTALTGDPESPGVVADSGATVVLMHMRGEPRTMQAAPDYDDAALDVYDTLAQRIEACVAAGIDRDRIVVDPGIGFGKTVAHNTAILRQTSLYHGLGCPLLIGVSRKRFIGALGRGEPPKERLGGSLAAALATVAQGAQILRVHDVAQTRQAIDIWRAVAPLRLENDAIAP